MTSLDQEIKKDKQELSRQNNKHSSSYKKNSYHNSNSNNAHHGFKSHNHNRYHNHHNRHHNRDRDRESPEETVERYYLKITKLDYKVTQKQLQVVCTLIDCVQSICQKHGQVKHCQIDWDVMGRSNETATVEFFNAKDAETVAKALRNTQVGDNQIDVELEVTVQKTKTLPKRHQIAKRYDNGRNHQQYRGEKERNGSSKNYRSY